MMYNKAKRKQGHSLVGQLKQSLLIVASLIASIFIFSIPISIIASPSQHNLDAQKGALQEDLNNILVSMINQETGLRGYITTDNITFLQPFTSGRPQFLLATQGLKSQAQGSDFKDTATALAQVEERATAWYSSYAEVQIHNMQSGKLAAARADSTYAFGKALFDKFRASVALLQDAMQHDLETIQSRLRITGSLIVLGALLLAGMAIIVLWYTFSRVFKALREQLGMLMSTTSLLGAGDLSARVQFLDYDELNHLGQVFNTMAEDLAIRSRELESTNREIGQQRDELLALNVALEEANQARSQFLSTMSHELRTPLASIIGFSQLLLDDAATADLSQQQQANLERILKNGQHLLGLVSDVLDLEKIEAGHMDLAYSRVDVRDLLTSVVEETQSMAIQRQLVLRAEVEEGVDFLESNAVKLHQILLNLVSNALKFTRQGEVTVSARRLHATDQEPDSVAFAVKDSGIGIPAEAQARIFEAFYQVEGGYTRKTGGTGLGLAIVSRLTSLLGGKLELTSIPEQGSIFTVTLPLKSTRQQAGQEMPRLHPARHEQAPTISPSSTEREPTVPHEHIADTAQREATGEERSLVLAVDDNPDVFVLLKDALQNTPYTVLGVQDPAKVMEVVQEMHPSAITLDVMMPDLNGWQILHLLKGNPATASIPVVMLTVLSEPTAGYVLGADDYLVKPFKRDMLLNTLQRLITSQQVGAIHRAPTPASLRYR